jgi:hypothetical protein
MSPELETLDQLSGGSLPLEVLRTLFPSNDSFCIALKGLAESGEIVIVQLGLGPVPSWQLDALNRSGQAWWSTGTFSAELTDVGARRIG